MGTIVILLLRSYISPPVLASTFKHVLDSYIILLVGYKDMTQIPEFNFTLHLPPLLAPANIIFPSKCGYSIAHLN